MSKEGEVHPIVFEALARGVRVDVGHGSHFSFEVAKRVLDAGVRPFTLGADLHGYNVRAPSAAGDRCSARKTSAANWRSARASATASCFAGTSPIASWLTPRRWCFTPWATR